MVRSLHSNAPGRSLAQFAENNLPIILLISTYVKG